MDNDISRTRPVPATPPARSRSTDERERLERNKLAKRLTREAGRAICDYRMIEAGDRVMV